MHPQARFTNGDAVTAADVKHSFEAMSGKFAAPGLRASLAGVERIVVLVERTNDVLFSRAWRHPSRR